MSSENSAGSGRTRTRRRRSKKKHRKAVEDHASNNLSNSAPSEESLADQSASWDRKTLSTERLFGEVHDELRKVRTELSLLRKELQATQTAGVVERRASTSSVPEMHSLSPRLERARSPPSDFRRMLKRVLSPRRSSDVGGLRRSPLYHSTSTLSHTPRRSMFADERGGTSLRNSTSSTSPRFCETTASDFESETSETLSGSPRVWLDRNKRCSVNFKSLSQTDVDADVQIGALLGSGALARVYDAKNSVYRSAIKIYCQSFGPNTESQCINLWRKLEAIRSLDRHPHIVGIFNNLIVREHLVSSMERMDCTLQDLLDERRDQRCAERSADAEGSCKKCTPTEISAEKSSDDNSDCGNARICYCSSPFTPLEVLGILHQCASGLAYLHALPEAVNVRRTGERVLAVWHRDIKAENICARRTSRTLNDLLREMRGSLPEKSQKESRIDKQYTFALADWDEARIIYDNSNVDRLGGSDAKSEESSSGKWENPALLPRAASSARRVAYSARRLPHSPHLRERLSLDVGTAQFMAPEMIDLSSDTYDEKVDIWSLGMVLYQLLTLVMPYELDRDVDCFSLSTRVESGLRPSLPQNSYLCDENESAGSGTEASARRDKKAWKEIVQMYKQCTKLNPRKRPSAEALLRRIETVQEALQ